MNIGIVTTWFERGAAYVSKLYMDTLENDNNVFIYARGGESYAKNDPNWDKENVYWSSRIPSLFSPTLIQKEEFINWIIQNNIELVIFNEQRWWTPLLWCRELNIKTVAYIDYYTEETIPLFKIYDAVICNTKKHYEAFKHHHNAIYIPWGTDVKTFKPLELKDNYTGPVSFFHSCGMAPHRKGTDLLIKSLPLIKDKDFLLTIHSQVNLRKQIPNLANLIDSLEKEGTLKIIEKTVPAPGLYHLGDIYVYPSRLEGIGLSVAEALSAGLFTIVPDCGPMNEFISENSGLTIKVNRYFSRSDGYYWPKNEVCIEDLALKMSTLISNKSKIPAMKLHARKHAINHLDWEVNSADLSSILRSLKIHNHHDFVMLKKNIVNYDNSGFKKMTKYYLRHYWVYKAYKKLKSMRV